MPDINTYFMTWRKKAGTVSVVCNSSSGAAWFGWCTAVTRPARTTPGLESGPPKPTTSPRQSLGSPQVPPPPAQADFSFTFILWPRHFGPRFDSRRNLTYLYHATFLLYPFLPNFRNFPNFLCHSVCSAICTSTSPSAPQFKPTLMTENEHQWTSCLQIWLS